MQAVIIGAGIAGPVTAMALQRVGIGAVIYEAHPPTDPDVGSYLTLTPNGLAALDAIGALDLVATAGFATRRNVLWNHAGRRLATLSLASTVPGSPVARTIRRSLLARLLQDEARQRGIAIHYGRRLREASAERDGRALATFEDGTTVAGDIVVGSDGVHSVVRRAIDQSAPQGRYVGLANFGGFTRGGGRDIEPEAWHLIFGRRAFFGYQATPAGDAVWFANVPRPAISTSERAATTPDGWRAQLADLFVSDDGPAVGLIEAGRLELAADNTHDLGHVPTWHRGPLVIVGDAAHAPAPTSGQGASVAIEDGLVLARALREHATVGEAFAAFERLRRERVERIVAWGAIGSSDKMPGPFGRLARDVMLRLLFRFVITDESLGWMYDYRVEWHEPAAERSAWPARPESRAA